MAAQTKENLSCPVCRDIFKDPVLLACSHSFCRACVERWWEQKPTRECPVCKTPYQCEDPPRNLALRNLCEAFNAEELCQLHSEKLSLFCLNDEELICAVCMHAEKHANHRFRPVDEAAKDHKQLLEESLKMLQEKLQEVMQSYDDNEVSYEEALLKVEQAKGRMKKVFETLQRLLREEEEARVAAMTEEVDQLSEKGVTLHSDMCSLLHGISEINEQLRAGDVAFLSKYKMVTREVQQLLLSHPEPSQEVEFDECKHLEDLTFNVLDRVKAKIELMTITGDEDDGPPTSDS